MGIKIQLRRDTAQNWINANPLLKSGEIGIETDTLKFKIGNGINRWNSLTSYAMRLGEANGVATLNSLGKIPTSQLPDIASVTQEVHDAVQLLTLNTTDIAEGTHLYFTTQRAIDAVSSGIANAIAVSETYVDSKISQEVNNRNSAIQSATNALTSELEAYASSVADDALTAANLNTSNRINQLSQTIPAIVNTAIVSPLAAETTDRNSAISAAITSEVTNRNTAIANAVAAIPALDLSTKTTDDLSEGTTNKYFTEERARLAVADNIATAVAGASFSLANKTTNDLAEGSQHEYFTIAKARQAAAYPISQLSDSVNSAFEDVYSNLSYLSETLTTLNNTVDTTSLTYADIDVAGGVAGLDNSVHVPDQLIPSTIARLNNTSLTGSTTAESLSAGNLTVSGNLVVNGTTTTISATNLSISDPLIYMAQGNSGNSSDIGLIGHATISGTYQHLGLVRDHSDGKWKLFSGVTTEPGSGTIDLGSATYDTLKIGVLEANAANIGSVTNTELQYVHGVTSSIQNQINSKAPTVSPTFTGIVTIPTGAEIADYLKSSVATSTYLSKSDAIATYLSKDSANANYLLQSDALNIYLTRSSATSTYLSKSDASSLYALSADVSSTYATLSVTSALSTRITTAQTRADNAYTLADTANNKASGYLNSNSSITTNKISYGTSTTPPAGTAAGDIYIQY
jgi:hypothetical protein